MNLQDRFYGSQIRGVGKKFITAVSDENLLEAKEAVETGLFGKAGEVLSEEASLQTIADRIISGDVTERLEESSKKSETKKSSKEEGWGEDEEEDEDEEMEESKDEEEVEEDSDEEDSKEEVKENFDPRAMMQMFQMMMAMAMMGNQNRQGVEGEQGVGGLKPEHARALGKMGGMNPGSVAGPGMGMGMGGGRR